MSYHTTIGAIFEHEDLGAFSLDEYDGPFHMHNSPGRLQVDHDAVTIYPDQMLAYKYDANTSTITKNTPNVVIEFALTADVYLADNGSALFVRDTKGRDHSFHFVDDEGKPFNRTHLEQP